jgi:hypothetical protein
MKATRTGLREIMAGLGTPELVRSGRIGNATKRTITTA